MRQVINAGEQRTFDGDRRVDGRVIDPSQVVTVSLQPMMTAHPTRPSRSLLLLILAVASSHAHVHIEGLPLVGRPIHRLKHNCS